MGMRAKPAMALSLLAGCTTPLAGVELTKAYCDRGSECGLETDDEVCNRRVGNLDAECEENLNRCIGMRGCTEFDICLTEMSSCFTTYD